MNTKLIVKYCILLLLVALGGSLFAAPVTQYTNTIFPVQTFTATSQTGSTIQLGQSPSGNGGAFAVATISVNGTALTTVTFSVYGSSDGGVTFYALPINAIATPGTIATTATATTAGLYQVNLAGITQVQIRTSGTFTATNATFVLTASPNGVIARLGSGSGGGGTTTNALTLNNGGTGAASGSTFNGSAAITLSYNTLGAAPLASPGLTGTPTAPTASAGTSTTQIATTAFTQAALSTGCTLGCSYVLTTGDAPMSLMSSGPAVGTVEQPTVVQFYNALSRKLGNACMILGTASASGHADVGVYNSSGTLVWHTGSLSTTTASSALCVTPTAATLAANSVYYVANCADNTTARWQSVASIPATPGIGTIAAAAPAHTAGSDTNAADNCTTGVLPSSITLANIVNSATLANIPYVYASN